MEVVISLKNISKIYDNKIRALDNVSLEVKAGETIGLLGPNGAGKTTLMRIIAGQLQPSSGEGIVLSKNLRELLRSEERFKLSYVPQENIFWPNLSVEENLWMMGAMYKIPKRELRNRIKKLLEEYELWEVRKRLARKLSGGMQKRLSIVMGLINDPEILILDEPTTGLDPAMRASVIGLLEKLNSLGKTILISSHIVENIERLCERVVIMDRGRIIADAQPMELKMKISGREVLEVLFNEIDKEVLEKLGRIAEERDMARAGYKIIIKGDDLIALSNEIRNDKALYENVITLSIRKSTLEDVFLF
ncbi:MAG: ABC transporter ATP-binding protein, partial [Candidatus Njordarchaeales archaeon]